MSFYLKFLQQFLIFTSSDVVPMYTFPLLLIVDMSLEMMQTIFSCAQIILYTPTPMRFLMKITSLAAQGLVPIGP
ncbi:hypothetical protein PAXRUDRAFT_21003 [Paxillus rubicundulus Ve08.2h10]|uniref:Uncharacterized protein n=1 Tax=Paxillus rubicundulus Ve08.2h10 TaxID=930991 RepID=A0A0D0BP40_9AGAM|nr:hypothetical protein PAXRUDRAFT_21003 [Paxillus rubicundulus Ve08.2h10]